MTKMKATRDEVREAVMESVVAVDELRHLLDGQEIDTSRILREIREYIEQQRGSQNVA